MILTALKTFARQRCFRLHVVPARSREGLNSSRVPWPLLDTALFRSLGKVIADAGLYVLGCRCFKVDSGSEYAALGVPATLDHKLVDFLRL